MRGRQTSALTELHQIPRRRRRQTKMRRTQHNRGAIFEAPCDLVAAFDIPTNPPLP